MANQNPIEGVHHGSVASTDERGTAEAIEGLYLAFERYPLSSGQDHCEHCVSEADEQRLRRGPLRALEPRDLSKYASKAMTTWGAETDFKHFLPRILELMVGGTLHVDPEIILGKLALAGWHAWPTEEVSAVRKVLRAWWREARASEGAQALTCLSALSRAKEDLNEALVAWWDDGRPEARACMLDFLALVTRPIVRGRDPSAFWEGGGLFIEKWFGDHERRDELLARWISAPTSYDDYRIGELLERWGAGGAPP